MKAMKFPASVAVLILLIDKQRAHYKYFEFPFLLQQFCKHADIFFFQQRKQPAFERVVKYQSLKKICKNSRAALSCVLPGNPQKPDKFRGIWKTNATLDRPRCAFAASGTAAAAETAAPALTSKSGFWWPPWGNLQPPASRLVLSCLLGQLA